MPEVSVTIGGRPFEVACQAGEEHFLRAAAKLLDSEARVLLEQIGRMPEARMLLMAGLMLADRTVGTEDELRALSSRVEALEAELNELRAKPHRVEVPLLPAELSDSLAELAARSEALAGEMEERLQALAGGMGD